MDASGLRVGTDAVQGLLGKTAEGGPVPWSSLGPASDGWGRDRADADTQEGPCPVAVCGAHVSVSSCSCNKTHSLAGSALEHVLSQSGGWRPKLKGPTGWVSPKASPWLLAGSYGLFSDQIPGVSPWSVGSGPHPRNLI